MLVLGVVFITCLLQNREHKLKNGYVKDNLVQFAMEDRYDKLMDINKAIINNTKCEFKNIKYGNNGEGTANIIVFAPDMDSSLMHIYLLEAGDRLLAGMSQDSSKKAYEFLTSMGVDVQFGKMVTDYKDHKVLMKDGQEIPTRTFLWVSGVKAQPITGIDGDHLGRGFRIVVDEFNRIPGMDGLFAIGDQCIQTTDPAYPGGHPQLAQVAIQQAALLAKNIQKIAEGAADSQLKPFRYKNLGSMATIGRNKAVVELGKFHSQGFFAWVLWLVVHLRSILGVKNKMMVMLNWLWKYVSYNDSIRMITYATKPKEVRDRLKREQTTHLGTDLLENEEEEEEA